jgi:preprotein translocase subunit SecA
MGFLNLLFSGNEREIAKMRKTVDKINSYEHELQKLTDEQLKAKTTEFRQRLADGETLDDLLPEAFAVVREAGVRTLGMRHFDVQMIGGIVLHQGRIAEMKTGEGKTLVATLPMYLNALEGKGAHLITTNDYLAKFHAQWMGGLYNFLGLSVGALQGSSVETGELEASYLYDADYKNVEEPVYKNLRRVEKRESYEADITYGTNHVYGFDYLRDNMVFSKEELSQRELNYAIVDEVDSILIDEARVPLIISGMPTQSSGLYQRVNRVISRLMPERDYSVDEKSRSAVLTEEGMKRVEEGLGVDNLSEDMELMHHANAALKAHALFKLDVDYVVKDGQVIIVDEFTGRLMFGRRYGDGLHQAIEAKEGVKIEQENQTLATITFQNYFRLYNKLAGMTGTAKTEEEEFRKIYGLDVVVIPTNMPMIRVDHPDVIFKTEEAKLRGLSMEILHLHCKLQPILVGTRSVEMSEHLSERLQSDKLQLLVSTFILRKMLDDDKSIDAETKASYQELLNAKFGEVTLAKLAPLAKLLHISIDMLHPDNVKRVADYLNLSDPDEIKRLSECLSEGIEHNVLNAKYHEREAEFIAEAGRLGAVTIATNMAGRGVDILLGGKNDGTPEREAEAKEVIKAGGLFIIGSERHESRRIDNQLRGRSGRQGDPGASKFFLSLEDELWRVFGDKSKSPLLNSWQEDIAMDSKLLTRMIEKTQKKMESHYFEARKRVLKYDDVMNVQRETIYGQRRMILEGADLKLTITEYLRKTVEESVNMYCPESLPSSEWDPETMYEYLNDIFPLSVYAQPDEFNRNMKRHEMVERLSEIAEKTYEDRENEIGSELMRDIERHIALRAINDKWIDHLDAMDYLLEGIGLRGYAQQDPIIAYKKEGFFMFEQMMQSIQDEIVRMMYRVHLEKAPEPVHSEYSNIQMLSNEFVPPVQSDSDESDYPMDMQDQSNVIQPVQIGEKVGRNDPCPCGSGKKYKKCCLTKK